MRKYVEIIIVFCMHGVTVNEFLEIMDFEELEEIQKDIAYCMICRKNLR